MTFRNTIVRRFANYTVAACLHLALLGGTARAVLLVSDEFLYDPAGSDLNGRGVSTGFGFSTVWSGQTSYNIGNGNLISPTDPLPSLGNSVSAVAFGGNRDIARTFVTPVGTEDQSLYISVLMQPIGILHQGAYDGWFGLSLRNPQESAWVYLGMNYGKDNYGLRLGDLYSTSSVAAAVGKTVFLVARIDYTEGVDPIRLYVNPRPGAPEPATANASFINNNVLPFTHLALTGPGGSQYDAIRIGTTYADVAPATSDFQPDGGVDALDLSVWKTGFGAAEGATPIQGDSDYDGDVDGRDFLLWQRQLGFQKSATAANGTVPEPGTCASACFAVAFACEIARRLRNVKLTAVAIALR